MVCNTTENPSIIQSVRVTVRGTIWARPPCNLLFYLTWRNVRFPPPHQLFLITYMSCGFCNIKTLGGGPSRLSIGDDKRFCFLTLNAPATATVCTASLGCCWVAVSIPSVWQHFPVRATTPEPFKRTVAIAAKPQGAERC